MKPPSNQDEFRAALKERVGGGLSADEAVLAMKESGFTIAEAITLIRELFGLSLGEAKSCVTRSPAWKETAFAADQLHEDLLREERSHREDE